MANQMVLQPRGRTFEELEEGFRLITAARTVTEADITNFAGVSGDFNPYHVDAETSSKNRFGERIAHGLLGLAIASGLLMQTNFVAGTVEAFASLDWKFRGPIRIGDTIHAEAEVVQRRGSKDSPAGFVVLNIEVINQRNETVQKGQWNVLIKTQRGLEAEVQANEAAG